MCGSRSPRCRRGSPSCAQRMPWRGSPRTRCPTSPRHSLSTQRGQPRATTARLRRSTTTDRAGRVRCRPRRCASCARRSPCRPRLVTAPQARLIPAGSRRTERSRCAPCPDEPAISSWDHQATCAASAAHRPNRMTNRRRQERRASVRPLSEMLAADEWMRPEPRAALSPTRRPQLRGEPASSHGASTRPTTFVSCFSSLSVPSMATGFREPTPP